MKDSSNIFSSLSWSGINQIGMMVITAISLIFFTKILTPEDFGLVGMVMAVASFSHIILDFGFGQAIIQRNDITDTDLCTVFWFNVITGLLVALLLVSFAQSIANFYQEPKVENIVYVISIAFPLSSLNIIFQVLLNKDLRFKTLATVRLSALFLSSTLGVYLSIIGWSYWGLVFFHLSHNILTTAFLWIVMKNQWTPKLKFNTLSIKKIAPFSLNVFGEKTIEYIATNIDKVLIGKFAGDVALGLYRQSYTFAYLPAQTVSQIVYRVLLPMLSKFDDKNTRNKVFIKYLGIYFFIITFLFFLIVCLSENLIEVLLGTNWLVINNLFRVFLMSSYFYVLIQFNNTYLLSLGKSKEVFINNLVFKILLVIGIVFLLSYELIMIGYLFLGIFFFHFLSSSFIVSINFRRLEVYPVIKDMFIVLTGVLLSYILANQLIINYFISYSALFKVIVFASFSIIVYIFYSFILKVEALKVLLSLMISSLRKSNTTIS